RTDTLLPILWGLHITVVCQGRIAESLQWVTEMLDAATRTSDSNLLIVGHQAAMVSYFWLGQFIKAREHGNKVLALYNEENHRHLVDLINHDPKSMAGTFATHWTW